MRLSHQDSREDRLRRARATARAGGWVAFTVIELVIVLLVMSIMAAAATPAFLDSLLFHRVESAARRVKADLELARQTARLMSKTQTVSFDSAAMTFGTDVKSFDLPNQTHFVDFTAAPFELDEIEADFAGAQTISFDGYGVPSAGGTVALRGKRHESIVTVNAATGDVTISSNHVRARSATVSN